MAVSVLYILYSAIIIHYLYLAPFGSQWRYLGASKQDTCLITRTARQLGILSEKHFWRFGIITLNDQHWASVMDISELNAISFMHVNFIPLTEIYWELISQIILIVSLKNPFDRSTLGAMYKHTLTLIWNQNNDINFQNNLNVSFFSFFILHSSICLELGIHWLLNYGSSTADSHLSTKFRTRT